MSATARKSLCGQGVVCGWMMVAVVREKPFRWQIIEDINTGAERHVLVVKIPGEPLREVVACPVCGGHPTAGATR